MCGTLKHAHTRAHIAMPKFAHANCYEIVVCAVVVVSVVDFAALYLQRQHRSNSIANGIESAT